jgi:hypothetical protein
MKARELIEKLTQLDPERDGLCIIEDDALLPEGRRMRLLEIVDVSEMDAERIRGDDQVAALKLGNGPNSERIAVIEVTSDF